MTAVRVPSRPAMTTLAQSAVALPVGQSYGASISQGLEFLLGRIMHPVVNVLCPTDVEGTRSYIITFVRSPGCNVIAVRSEVNTIQDSSAHPATSSARNGKVSITINGSTAAPVFLVHQFDGSQNVRQPCSNATAGAATVIAACSTGSWFQEYWDYFDVSGVTVNTPYTMMVTWTDDGSGVTLGLESIGVFQVAIADCDPVDFPTTEIGVDGSWTVRRNHIFDGSASTASGTERWLDQYEQARHKNPRQCFQLVGQENLNLKGTYGGAGIAGTSTTIDNPLLYANDGTWNDGLQNNTYQEVYASQDGMFCMRPRTLWGTSTPSRYQLRLRYQTSTTQTITLRTSVRPGTGGAWVNTDYVILSSAGAWKETLVDQTAATMYVNIPTSDTTGNGSGVGAPLAFVRFRCWNNSAGTFYISNLALIEAET